MTVAFLLTQACRDYPLTGNTDVELRVWTEVTPKIVSIRDTTAVFTIRLGVQNGTDQEISVISGAPPYVFTGNPANSVGLSGSIRIANSVDSLFAGSSIDWWGQQVYTFGPR